MTCKRPGGRWAPTEDFRDLVALQTGAGRHKLWDKPWDKLCDKLWDIHTPRLPTAHRVRDRFAFGA